MKNFNYSTLNFKLNSGTNGESFDTPRIKRGKIIGIGIYTAGALPTNTLVNATLKNSGGDDVFSGSCLQDWKPKEGAGYIESLKPVNLEGSRDFTIDFSTKAALTSDVSGQVVFVIDASDNCEQQ